MVGELLDCLINVAIFLNRKDYRFIRASLYTAPAAATVIVDHRLAVNQLDGIHETDPFCAFPTPNAIFTDLDAYPRHAINLGADLRRDFWQHFPQTAARAAVADG